MVSPVACGAPPTFRVYIAVASLGDVVLSTMSTFLGFSAAFTDMSVLLASEALSNAAALIEEFCGLKVVPMNDALVDHPGSPMMRCLPRRLVTSNL